MREYDKKFLVECQVCGKILRVINALHLKQHNLTVEGYRSRYPDAPFSKFMCTECGNIIEDSPSTSPGYCDRCRGEVRRRKNRESKRRRSRELHRNLSKDDISVIADHHYPGLGTTEPSTWLDKITIDGAERIEGAVWLQMERRKRGARSDLQTRSEAMSDHDT